MTFYPGLQIEATKEPLGFFYGQGVFGPKEEVRRLEDIRHSLEDKNCDGPEELYAIVMDIGNEEDLCSRGHRTGACPFSGTHSRHKPFLRRIHTGSV